MIPQVYIFWAGLWVAYFIVVASWRLPFRWDQIYANCGTIHLLQCFRACCFASWWLCFMTPVWCYAFWCFLVTTNSWPSWFDFDVWEFNSSAEVNWLTILTMWSCCCLVLTGLFWLRPWKISIGHVLSSILKYK